MFYFGRCSSATTTRCSSSWADGVGANGDAAAPFGGRGLMTDALMTDTPPHPAGEQVVRPLWAGFGPSQGIAAAETLSHPREAQQLLPEPLSRSIKMHFSVRKSAPKHVHLIFPASVCATFHMVFSVTLRSLTSGSTSSTLQLQGTAGST